jgi:multimeric flavodoxin WrbA
VDGTAYLTCEQKKSYFLISRVGMKASETHVAAQEQVRILGISGSLRKASFGTAILWALARRTSASMSIDVMTLEEIPFYNEDLDCPPGPLGVENMKKLIAESDGVLIATPEYDHGIPGVLKDALDWASRPGRPNAYNLMRKTDRIEKRGSGSDKMKSKLCLANSTQPWAASPAAGRQSR